MNLREQESADRFEKFKRFNVITNAYIFTSSHNKSHRILNCMHI